MKENGRSFLDASGNISFYDGTNAYVMRQENDHDFKHYVAMIMIMPRKTLGIC